MKKISYQLMCIFSAKIDKLYYVTDNVVKYAIPFIDDNRTCSSFDGRMCLYLV